MKNPHLRVLGPDDRPPRQRKGRPPYWIAHDDPLRPLTSGASVCGDACADCVVALERLAAIRPRIPLVLVSRRAFTTASAELAVAAAQQLGGFEGLLPEPCDRIDVVVVGKGRMPKHRDWWTDHPGLAEYQGWIPRPPFVKWLDYQRDAEAEPDDEYRMERGSDSPGWSHDWLRPVPEPEAWQDTVEVADELVTDWRVVRLEEMVGGPGALATLTDAPLPDEPLATEGIDADVVGVVRTVGHLVDGWCTVTLTSEHRTAARRLLALAARQGPDLFRREIEPKVLAATVCWLVVKANCRFGPELRAADLAEHFGVSPTAAGNHRHRVLKAAGIDCPSGEVRLGSPAFLVSARRAQILEQVASFIDR